MDLCFVVDSRLVATTGLVMDIVGIGLLFNYGAIGGRWLEPRDFVDAFGDSGDDEHLLSRERKRAWWRASCGLGLAITGFVLQAVALWLQA